jgi:shikimate kinase
MQKKGRVLTFIGMSGVGKSYWAEKFREIGYKTFNVDDLIQEKLGDLINEVEADKNVKFEETKVGDLAKWMGFPGDKRYPGNAKKYLKLETKITEAVLKQAIKSGQDTIIDTTGSVIYTDKKIQTLLRKHSKVVFFDTTKQNLKEMFEVFCKVPKPIIWGNIYKAKKGEPEDKTLARCYQELLNSRIKKYKKLAHIALPYKFTHTPNLDTAKFIKKINK